MASQQRLEVIVGPATWWLAPPADLPLPTLLAGLGGKQAEAVQELMSTQWPLSELLRRRIRAHDRNSGCACFSVQLVFGICLPSGLLIGTQAFDYDRDVDVLRREVAAVVAQRLPPGSWDLQESIDSEAAFAGGGKRLLALYLT